MIGQQAVVVGAGDGLGRSLALLLSGEGYDIGLNARREGPLQALAAEIVGRGGTATTLVADATEPDAVGSAVATLADRVPIGVLVYNAAAAGGPLIDTDVGTLGRAMNVNVLSAVAATRFDPDRIAAAFWRLAGSDTDVERVFTGADPAAPARS